MTRSLLSSIVLFGLAASASVPQNHTILVTGGCGYIGSHTVVELLSLPSTNVIIIDDLSNSSPKVLDRIHNITGKEPIFYNISLMDRLALSQVIRKHGNEISAVIHFAGFKAVGESWNDPLKYYENNIVSTINLLQEMKSNNITNFVFSSSATVYGEPDDKPLTEDLGGKGGIYFPTSPYGKTKYIAEIMLKDVSQSKGGNNAWGITVLRYFNPAGAHPSGKIGEDPREAFNLMPILAQVASGKRKNVSVFGQDYNTPDGTGVRDYIHVVDLAKGHVAALNGIFENETKEYNIYNLGSGTGFSVMQMIKAMEKASNRTITKVMTKRRPGDVPYLIANPELAHKKLGWKTEKSLDDICTDLWRWQSQNPNGYE